MFVGSGVGVGVGSGVGSGVTVGVGDGLEVILEIGSESWMSLGSCCIPAIPPITKKMPQKATSRQVLAVLLSFFMLLVRENQMDKEMGQMDIAMIQNQTGCAALNAAISKEPFVGVLLAGWFCAPEVCGACGFADAAFWLTVFFPDGFFLDVCALDSVV